MTNTRRISRLLSLMLRHRPDEFGLEIDDYGFVPLDQVVQAVQERYEEVRDEEVLELLNAPDQHRFEMREEMVRALYGHSFFVEMDGEPMETPEKLYMGATARAAGRYKRDGIGPGDRFYVHLSIDRETAEERSREESGPVVVEILAAEAREAGVEFYARGAVVLTRQVPAEFVGEIYGMPAREESDSTAGEERVSVKVTGSGDVSYGRKPRRATR